jgi:hypothetical protein
MGKAQSIGGSSAYNFLKLPATHSKQRTGFSLRKSFLRKQLGYQVFRKWLEGLQWE